MQVARRVYIYLVTFISLLVMLAGAVGLLQLLVELALGSSRGVLNDSGFVRQQFSTSGALMLVGALVWTIHWILARRSVSASNPDADQERLSVLRKLLIYGVLFVAAWQIFFALSQLLRDVFLWLFSIPITDMGQAIADTVPALFVYSIAWLYYWRVAYNDNRLTPEDTRCATVRRWYFYLVSYGTLSILMFYTADLGRRLWEAGTRAGGFGAGSVSPFVSDVAWIVVAAAFWLSHWLIVQRVMSVSEDEQRSVLRKVYLYFMVFQTLSVTVTSLAFFLNSILRLILGTNPLGNSADSLLTQAGGPLMTALVYGLMWAYHWRVLQWDAALVAEEPPRQANIRRAYHYLVALVGLAVLGAGVANLVTLLIDVVSGGGFVTDLGRQTMGDRISLAATLIIVGGPVWYVNWLRLQKRALAPDGAKDRHALLRRIYLYLILFFSVITLLVSAGTLLYQIFLIVGGGASQDFMHNLAGVLGPAIAAGLILAYHLRTIAADQRAFAALPPEARLQPAHVDASALTASTVLLLRSANPDGLAAAVEGLRRRLPTGAQLETFVASNLMPEELGAWLADRAPQDVATDPAGGSALPPTTIVGQTELAPES
jgi:hypothetical protein